MAVRANRLHKKKIARCFYTFNGIDTLLRGIFLAMTDFFLRPFFCVHSFDLFCSVFFATHLRAPFKKLFFRESFQQNGSSLFFFTFVEEKCSMSLIHLFCFIFLFSTDFTFSCRLGFSESLKYIPICNSHKDFE